MQELNREIIDASSQAVIMNIPSFNRIANPKLTLNQTIFQKLVVKLKEPENVDHYKLILKTFKSSSSSFVLKKIDVFNHFEDTETLDEILLILDMIFGGVLIIVMFLCFFSLASSMSSNVLESAKEIGIIRFLGYTKRRIKMLYFYEAFILVMSSCSLGVFIGTLVGCTMLL